VFGGGAIDSVLLELAARLPVFILASLRVGLTFAGMPAPFGNLAPVRIRTAVTVLVTAVMLLPMLPKLPVLPLQAAVLAKAAVYELFIGMLLGLTVRVMLAAADAAGSFAGQAMGLGFAGSIDPLHGESSVPTGYILESVATLIFFSLGCHHVVLSALAASFHAAPIGAPISAAWRGAAVGLGADLIARGVQIASPVIASMFIVQVGIAFVSRTAPRVHLFAFTFAISTGAGLLLLWAAAPAVCTAVVRHLQQLPDALAALGNH
jgi:flagellar biosynthetic protein FliR